MSHDETYIILSTLKELATFLASTLKFVFGKQELVPSNALRPIYTEELPGVAAHDSLFV